MVAPATGKAPAASSSKKTAVKSKSKPVAMKTASHPSTAVMVNNVLQTLNERGGSSLQAIKKSVSGMYKLDIEKIAPYIKKYIKQAVENGLLVQTKGVGASGSFKLPPKSKSKAKSAKEEIAPPKKKTTVSEKEKTVKAKTSPKKADSSKKVVKNKISVPTKPRKAPSKVKTTRGSPAKKPKSPKPKTTKNPIKKPVTKK